MGNRILVYGNDETLLLTRRLILEREGISSLHNDEVWGGDTADDDPEARCSYSVPKPLCRRA
jgi:hypothetical protein